MAEIIGLDFGGCNTEILVKGKGIVLREPSIAAVDLSGYVVAVGAEALLLRGRAPGSVTIRRPIRDSVVSDFNLTAEMFDRFLETAVPKKRKHVWVAVRCGVGTESRALIKNALADCRTSRIELVESPLAALAGSGYSDANGIIVCDIGAGSVESSFIRGGDILRTETYFGGGRDADKQIRDHVRRKYGVVVTKIAAQAAKHQLNLSDNPDGQLALSGVDGATGLPVKIEVPTREIIRYAAPQIKGALDCVNAVLTNLPRYAGKPSSAERVVLVGGGAMLPGIAAYISEACGCETVVPEAPMDCVARGLEAFTKD